MSAAGRGWLVAMVATLGTGCWHDHAPPPAATASCIDVADHVEELMTAPIGAVVLRRCTTDRWADDVLRCMLAETATDRRHCKRALTPGQRVALARDLAEMRAPAACESYRHAVFNLGQCASLPPEVRNDVRRDFVRVMTAKVAPDARAVLCRSAFAAIDPRTLARCTGD